MVEQQKDEKIPGEMKCQNCIEDNRESVAKVVCDDCKSVICDECNVSIHANKILAKHTRRSLEQEEFELALIAARFCKIHEAKNDLFCLFCQEFICTTCAFSASHKEHNIKVIEEVLQTPIYKVDRALSGLTDDISLMRLQQKLEEIQSKIDEIERKKQEGRKLVEDTCNDLISNIIKQREKCYEILEDRALCSATQMKGNLEEKMNNWKILSQRDKMTSRIETSQDPFEKLFLMKYLTQCARLKSLIFESIPFVVDFDVSKIQKSIETLSAECLEVSFHTGTAHKISTSDILTDLNLTKEIVASGATNSAAWKYLILSRPLKPGRGKYFWEVCLKKIPFHLNNTWKYMIGVIEKDKTEKLISEGKSINHYGWFFTGNGDKTRHSPNSWKFLSGNFFKENLWIKIEVDFTEKAGKLKVCDQKNKYHLMYDDINSEVYPAVGMCESTDFHIVPFVNFTSPF